MNQSPEPAKPRPRRPGRIFAGIRTALVCALAVAAASGPLLSTEMARAANRPCRLYEALSALLEPERPAPADPLASETEAGQAGDRRRKKEWELLAVPEGMGKYFDRKTGAFNYRPQRTYPLAVENGDAPLHALRMNWVSDLEPGAVKGLSRDHLRTALKALRQLPGTKLWIVALPEDAPEIRRELAKAPKTLRSRILLIHQGGDARITYWAQDGSKPMATEIAAVRPADLIRSGFPTEYSVATYALQWAKVIDVKRSPFRFEGGNVVVGERHVFVGSDIVEAAMVDFGITRDEATRALSAEFGKPVLEIGVQTPEGWNRQIDYHIDLTLAVVRDRKTGKEKVLVESQRELFRALLGKRKLETLPSDSRRFLQALTGKGQSDFSRFLSEVDVDRFVQREKELDQVAALLESQGYDVERVPGMMQLKNRGEEGHRRHPVVFNYTNAIFSKDVAIIPELGLPAVDRAVRNQFRSLGYKVVPAPVAQKAACLHGGIRCLTETYRVPNTSRMRLRR